jgi:hypothetical protein
MLQLAGEKENGRTADHQIVAGQERCLIPNSAGIIAAPPAENSAMNLLA